VDRGFCSAFIVASRDDGIKKGASCEGIEGGRRGNFDGARMTRRGVSRRGSTCFRYVVKMSGNWLGLRKGTSRLGRC